jgi:cytochrome d ubiquinol oxidase subunit II
MNTPLFSASLVAFALTLYVLLDGFDLGVGCLLLFERHERVRDHMMDSITPTWDGNETWLVMAAVVLFAAFPIAYGVLLPALYLPVIVMLLALGVRGVCFEFRTQIQDLRGYWDIVFAVGSAIAALMQGMILGAILQGIDVKGNAFGGRVTEFATPYSFLCGVTVLCAYAILGAGWLRYKGTAILHSFSLRAITTLIPIFVLMFGTASILSLRVQPAIVTVWQQDSLWLGTLVAIMLFNCLWLLSAGRSRSDYYPFLSALVLVAVGVVGLMVIIFPNIVPFRIALWDAASSSLSQIFVLVGACAVIPVVLGYSFFAYWVFRGKTPREGWDA